jgi:hypothetical protein
MTFIRGQVSLPCKQWPTPPSFEVSVATAKADAFQKFIADVGEGGASRTGSEPQKGGGDCIVLLEKKEKGKETMYSC